MAKKKRRPGIKSQAVRSYLMSHPQAMPKEVCDALAAQGIKVTAQLVSNIRASLGGRRPTRSKKLRIRGGTGGLVSVDQLLYTNKLVDRLGSIQAVRTALEALAQLR